MEKTLRIVGDRRNTLPNLKLEWSTLLEQARKALAKAVEIRVDPSCVRPLPGQPREYFNEASILRLVDSIRGVGQVYPGIVRAIGINTYELLDGERRWRAITIIGMPYRALLVEIESEAVPFLIAAIANFNHEAHSALEIVDTIRNLHENMNMPIEEVAKVLGITKGWTYQMYNLRKLHPEVRALLDPALPKNMQFPVSAALQIARMERDLQPQLAQRFLAKDVSVNRLSKEVERISKLAGSQVLLRKQSPSDRWRAIGRRVSHLRRYVGDMEDSINHPDLPKMVRTRMDGFGVEEALQTIQDVQRFLERTERLLLKAKNTL